MIVELLLLGILFPLDVAQAGEVGPWQAEGFGDKLEFSADAANLGPVLFPPIPGDRNEVLLTEPDAWEGTVHPLGEIAQGDPATAPEGTAPRQGTPLHRGTTGEQPFIPQRIPFRPRTDVTTQSKPYAASPGITVMTPSGYGAGWGSAGFGLGLQERTRFTNTSDGVAGFGIGFGNPRENIGLT
ncbi:MAG: hypothetical protein ACRC8Y_06255, partial [Chroococcales cyanobacterium]